jgi:DNA-binding transcriptional regulator YiaG
MASVMPSVAVEFDFAEVLPTIRAAHSRANVDDAEEAISVACVELLAKGTPLTAANVVTRARSRLRDRFNRCEARNSSLDAALEEDVDHSPVELAVDEVDFEAHGKLREARDNVILRRRLAASEVGAPELRRRGTAAVTRGKAFSDETVAEARRLRREGLKMSEIAERIGCGETTVWNWIHGRMRRAPTSNPGWTRKLVIEAISAVIAEDGLHPPSPQMKTDPRLPNSKTFYRLFRSWPEAVKLALDAAPESDNSL